MDTPIIQIKNLVKYFHDPVKSQVLKGVTFNVNKGEFLSIVGKSGSGKSTLLYLISTMDTSYEGEIIINDQNLNGKTQNELAAFRNKNIGFVFQFHYLLNDFTVLQNIMLPALKRNEKDYVEIEADAFQLLDIFGLRNQALKKANKLSGGQQQRIAIARSLINKPSIIMGDEPTGNLDSFNSQQVQEIFMEFSSTHGQTIICVTHDLAFARKSNRIIEMQDGQIISST
jgi:lipoprotein-releasing system ATP-binding protein